MRALFLGLLWVSSVAAARPTDTADGSVGQDEITAAVLLEWTPDLTSVAAFIGCPSSPPFAGAPCDPAGIHAFVIEHNGAIFEARHDAVERALVERHLHGLVHQSGVRDVLGFMTIKHARGDELRDIEMIPGVAAAEASTPIPMIVFSS